MSDHGQERSADRIREVEAHSTGFRRELGLMDLVLIQIMYVVGSGWVGTAASKMGTGHIVGWLLAAALFYLPQAVVVIYLNRLMPLEGGLYQWATVGLGKFTGYLVAWNLWAYAILMSALFGVVFAQNLTYIMGTNFVEAFGGERPYTAIMSVFFIAAITFVSVLGLRVGKWVQNVGGAAQILAFVALIALPFILVWRGTIAEYDPFRATIPEPTLLNFNTFGKLAVGALSGFEYVAILAGECRNPSRSIGRSVIIAVPVIVVMFILGTSSVLALVPPNVKIDLISPIPQTFRIACAGWGEIEVVAHLLILLLLLRHIGNVMLIFAGNTRLPMVAGWDGFLPAWFTRIHPRFRTPTNSILFAGALMIVLTLAGQIDVDAQHAFQLIENAGGILYGLTYLGLFAIPIVASKALGERPPLWLRAACVVGFAVTVLYCFLSIFPIIDVKEPWLFTCKIVGTIVVTNVLGIVIYVTGRRRGATLRTP